MNTRTLQFITLLEYRALRKLGLTTNNLDIFSISPGQINILAGPSGGGKSTILDAISVAGHPGNMLSLKRDNPPSGVSSRLRLRFANRKEISLDLRYPHNARSGPYVVSANAVLGIYLPSTDDACSGPHKFGADITEGGDLSGFSALLEQTGILVRVIGPAGCANVSHADISKELDRLSGELTGMQRRDSVQLPHRSLPASLVGYDSNTYRNVFADDPLTVNGVPPQYMPSGWMQLGGLMAQLRDAPKGSICLIEEPETHLHASLQRTMATAIAALAKERDLQLFLSTHSSVLLNSALWPADATAFFRADGDRVQETKLNTGMLNLLGVKSADLMQSNGVIWVEGPSDRLYFNALLAELQRQQGQTTSFREDVHYSFGMFGGACISHFTADGDRATANLTKLIDVIRINRNAAVAIDRDADFVVDDFGDLCAINGSGRNKAHVLNEIGLDSAVHGAAFIGEQYTIESYLPPALANRGSSKVERAMLATRDNSVPRIMLDTHADLRHGVQRLLNAVAAWNAK